MQYERDQVVNKTKSRYGLESESAVAKQLHDLIGSVVQGDNRQIVDVINQSNADNKAIFNELVNTIVSDPNNRDLAKAIILENVEVDEMIQFLIYLKIIIITYHTLEI